ncbi:MAG: hypothetical protein ACD_4C00439G0004 [uncultured bacterium (gcode 4)]|uniref:Uncharacterized protein n=1 Tax=uncultured bacterium (gcode 4) TaxID=1234023 RepID=K2FW45_9BACT|nr:MAG: hypothetical protein ACD_4C00439G0004 [uncultured bacterium (gcode 4)]
MQEILIQISDFLNINPNNDIYILGVLLIFIIIFLILWITKIYESLFWAVLGISIYIVLQSFLWNNWQDWYIIPFFSQNFLSFIVSSSLYLIIILSFLIPINSSLNINEPKNPWIKIALTLILSLIHTVFFFGILIWLTEKIYIFKTYTNAFNLIKKIPTWNNFISWSKVYEFFMQNIHIIIVFWTVFVIYKVIFSDIVNAILNWFLVSMKNMMANKWWWGWWHEDHHWH